MKDVLKTFGLYFAISFGSITGIICSMKLCEKLFDKEIENITKEE